MLATLKDANVNSVDGQDVFLSYHFNSSRFILVAYNDAIRSNNMQKSWSKMY